MQIKYVAKIDGTPLVRYLVVGWLNLANENYVDPCHLSLGYDYQCFYAVDRQEIVGAIAFSKIDWSNSFNIKLGYVSPAFRRRGIYGRLWNALVAKAKKDKIRCIDGSCRPANKEIAAFNKRVGRKLVVHVYEFQIAEASR